MILQNLVQEINVDQLRALALGPLRRQPATFADIVNGEIAVGDGLEPPNLKTKMSQSGVSVGVVLQCPHKVRINTAQDQGKHASQQPRC